LLSIDYKIIIAVLLEICHTLNMTSQCDLGSCKLTMITYGCWAFSIDDLPYQLHDPTVSQHGNLLPLHFFSRCLRIYRV